jgi:TolB-like protein
VNSSPANNLESGFRVGEWLVRPGECRIENPQGELRLRPMLMDLLVLLAGRAGEVVPKEEILERLRKTQFVSESALTSDIAELRRVLGDSRTTPRYIETVAKRGYRIIARVETRGQSAQPRLAVLLFENLNRDPEQDYFAEGMSDALITELGKIGSLRVISRQSVLRFKDTQKSLPEIARELMVEAVVEGAALHAGNRVRISAQLVQAEPERHLWAESYECDMNDVLAVQGRIARSVAEAVKATLTPKDLARLSRPRPVGPEVHMAYLKARYHSGTWTKEGVEKALQYLNEAMQADPGFAPAYGMLSFCMITLGYWGHLPHYEAYPKAKEAALKALALDESLSEAHAALGLVRWLCDWNPADCETEIRRALELQPSSDFAHFVNALFLVTMSRDRDRAPEAARLALELDPLSVNTNFSFAFILLFAGEHQRAVEQALKTIELHPDSPLAWQALGWAYVGLSDYGEAARAFQKAVDLSRDAHSLSALAYAQARSGQRAAAEALLGELIEKRVRDYVPEVCFVTIYAGLGDRDRAFDRLEKCYQERDPHLFWLPVMPAFQILRQDPRFDELLHRLKLTG